jgi:hypothetical protein
MNLQLIFVFVPEPVAEQAYLKVIGIPSSGFPLSTSIARTEYSCPYKHRVRPRRIKTAAEKSGTRLSNIAMNG